MDVLIEMAFKSDSVFYLYFDQRFVRELSSIIKAMRNNNLEFYLVSPKFKNPRFIKFDDDFHSDNIENFIHALKFKEFHFSFNKIGFDPIEHLIKYQIKFELSDEIIQYYLEKIKLKAQYSSIDWMSGKRVYDFDIDIREYFSNLWRDIRLSKITININNL